MGYSYPSTLLGMSLSSGEGRVGVSTNLATSNDVVDNKEDIKVERGTDESPSVSRMERG